jgi:hypothetical protein
VNDFLSLLVCKITRLGIIRKFRVTTEIGSTFFSWQIVTASSITIVPYVLEFSDFGRKADGAQSIKIGILGFFYQHEISD